MACSCSGASSSLEREDAHQRVGGGAFLLVLAIVVVRDDGAVPLRQDQAVGHLAPQLPGPADRALGPPGRPLRSTSLAAMLVKAALSQAAPARRCPSSAGSPTRARPGDARFRATRPRPRGPARPARAGTGDHRWHRHGRRTPARRPRRHDPHAKPPCPAGEPPPGRWTRRFPTGTAGRAGRPAARLPRRRRGCESDSPASPLRHAAGPAKEPAAMKVSMSHIT